MDFSKAFDTVCHSKIILKLDAYSVTEALLRWLCSFLTGRSFAVKVSDSLPNSLPVCSGVLQESILDPLLFLIYINGLPGSIVNTCKIFADYVKIYRPSGDSVVDFGILQDDLDRLSVWSRTWELAISDDHGCSLKIEGHSLNSDNGPVRDLGVNFDLGLQWGSHC